MMPHSVGHRIGQIAMWNRYQMRFFNAATLSRNDSVGIAVHLLGLFAVSFVLGASVLDFNTRVPRALLTAKIRCASELAPN